MITKEKLASLVQAEKKSQKVENFIGKCNYKTYVSFILNFLITLISVLTYYFSNFLASIFILMSDIDY